MHNGEIKTHNKILTCLSRIRLMSPRALSREVIAGFGHWPFPWLECSFSISLRHFWIRDLLGDSILIGGSFFDSYSWPLEIKPFKHNKSKQLLWRKAQERTKRAWPFFATFASLQSAHWNHPICLSIRMHVTTQRTAAEQISMKSVTEEYN
jgi:hypothetical protein